VVDVTSALSATSHSLVASHSSPACLMSVTSNKHVDTQLSVIRRRRRRLLLRLLTMIKALSTPSSVVRHCHYIYPTTWGVVPGCRRGHGATTHPLQINTRPATCRPVPKAGVISGVIIQNWSEYGSTWWLYIYTTQSSRLIPLRHCLQI